MSVLGVLPWFAAAAELLDLRRQDRVLLIGPGQNEHVRSIASAVGRSGAITVLEPDRERAEAIAALELAQVEVLALQPVGGESFGSFDAVLHCPMLLPTLPLAGYGEVALHNLRPGGRYVVDVPGPEMIPDVAAAADRLTDAQDWLPRLRGPSEVDLAGALRLAGLRRVETALGSHLLTLPSVHDLAEWLANGLGLGVAATVELAAALRARLRGTSPAELLVHRTRVHAIR
jgi:hypothetical protein